MMKAFKACILTAVQSVLTRFSRNTWSHSNCSRENDYAADVVNRPQARCINEEQQCITIKRCLDFQLQLTGRAIRESLIVRESALRSDADAQNLPKSQLNEAICMHCTAFFHLHGRAFCGAGLTTDVKHNFAHCIVAVRAWC